MWLTHIVLVQKRHKVHAGYKVEEVGESSIRNKNKQTNKQKSSWAISLASGRGQGAMYSEFEKKLLHKCVGNMQKNKRLSNGLELRG